MATFHPFPRLPWELRAQIWEMAFEPRNVCVIVASNLHDPKVYKDYPKFELWGPRIYTHDTPVPAVLHVCHEARNHFQRLRIYEQAFNITPTVILKEFHDTPKFRAWRCRKKSKKRGGVAARLSDANAQADQERRYIWVNFHIDTINIRNTEFWTYKDWDGDKIQRLQINIRTTRFEHFESTFLLDSFPNLKELYIDCRIGDVENWDYHYEELDKLVGAENVWLIPHPRLDPGIFKTTISLARMRSELHEY